MNILFVVWVPKGLVPNLWRVENTPQVCTPTAMSKIFSLLCISSYFFRGPLSHLVFSCNLIFHQTNRETPFLWSCHGFIVPGEDSSQLSILRVDQTEYIRRPALIIPGHGASSQSAGALPSITSQSPPSSCQPVPTFREPEFLSVKTHFTTFSICLDGELCLRFGLSYQSQISSKFIIRTFLDTQAHWSLIDNIQNILNDRW